MTESRNKAAPKPGLKSCGEVDKVSGMPGCWAAGPWESTRCNDPVNLHSQRCRTYLRHLRVASTKLSVVNLRCTLIRPVFAMPHLQRGRPDRALPIASESFEDRLHYWVAFLCHIFCLYGVLSNKTINVVQLVFISARIHPC